MSSEFGISNVQLYISIALVILNESTAFFRFNRISKNNDVDGTQIGIKSNLKQRIFWIHKGYF